MSEFQIPCDTVARLSKVLHGFPEKASVWANSIRIENGIVITTNRYFMAIEKIAGSKNQGIIHLVNDPALIEQCAKEAAYKSTLTIVVNETLKYASAKTTFGYVFPGNAVVWSDVPNELDGWKAVVEKTVKPAAAPRGGMFWDADNLARLAASSPSGNVVFEEIIDTIGRPTLIRDVLEYHWLGVFNSHDSQRSYAPASLPDWVLPR